MTREQVRRTGWLMASGLAVLTLVATIPYARYRSPYYMDDWDLVYDLITRPWMDYLVRPNVSGHFFPLFKAVYGLCLRLGGLKLEVLLAVQYFCRLLLALLWVRLLVALRCWSPTAALLCLTAFLNEVGVIEVFFWGVELGHELAILAFVAALDGAIRLVLFRRPVHLMQMVAASLAGAFCFGSGVVPLVSIGAAFVLAGPRDDVTKKAVGAQLAAALCVAVVYVLRSPEAVVPLASSASESLLRPAVFFFFGTIVNPAISGLAVQVTSGLINVGFFLLLVAGTLVVLRLDPSREVRVAAAALLLTSIGIGILLAVTKWPRGGSAYGASYRYCFNHVALQMPLVGLLLVRVPVLLAGGLTSARRLMLDRARYVTVVALCALAVFGGLRGTTRLQRVVSERRDCLAAILAAQTGTPACYVQVYYRKDGSYLRGVWRLAAASEP
jgi:hypothetical protein